MKLVLASNNAKKIAELRALFDALFDARFAALSAASPVELVAQGMFGIAEADEPHGSFIENALAKARHAAKASGLPAIADDSGLCVEALGGAPGVHSAHFAPAVPPRAEREAQRREQDEANNRLLIQRLAGQANRRGRFVSTLVALRSADDPEPLVAFGRWEGEVLQAPRGDNGFGYDALMYFRELGATAAQLAPEVKNLHSHRARAAVQMLQLLREVWHLG